jgi:hypothetical protein
MNEQEIREKFAKICDQIAKDHRENPREDIGYASYSEGAAETAEDIAIYLREGK